MCQQRCCDLNTNTPGRGTWDLEWLVIMMIIPQHSETTTVLFGFFNVVWIISHDIWGFKKNKINGHMLRWFLLFDSRSLWSLKAELNRKPSQKRKWLLRDVLLTNDYIDSSDTKLILLIIKTQNFFKNHRKRKWFLRGDFQILYPVNE